MPHHAGDMKKSVLFSNEVDFVKEFRAATNNILLMNSLIVWFDKYFKSSKKIPITCSQRPS